MVYLCLVKLKRVVFVILLLGGYPVAEIRAHKKDVLSLHMSWCHSYVLSTGMDKVINVWKVLDYKKDVVLETAPYIALTLQSIPNCMDMHPNQSYCAVGMWNATIQIWNYIANKKLAVFHGCHSSVRDCVEFS